MDERSQGYLGMLSLTVDWLLYVESSFCRSVQKLGLQLVLHLESVPIKGKGAGIVVKLDA